MPALTWNLQATPQSLTLAFSMPSSGLTFLRFPSRIIWKNILESDINSSFARWRGESLVSSINQISQNAMTKRAEPPPITCFHARLRYKAKMIFNWPATHMRASNGRNIYAPPLIVAPGWFMSQLKHSFKTTFSNPKLSTKVFLSILREIVRWIRASESI